MRNKESFNTAAALYDRVRPSYPDQLIEWIITKTQITQSDELLEIAPGTGQCTRKFAERGYMIHTVELGDQLAKLLLQNMESYTVTVDVSSFEDWVPKTDKKYKLVYCATAWHWLDPTIKYQKTSDLLELDGRLAIIWNNALGVQHNDIIDKAYQLLFSYHTETPHSTKPKTVEEVKLESMGTKDMLEESGHYVLEDYYEQTWSKIQPREIFIDGFYSQSSFLSLSDSDKNELKEKLATLFMKLDEELDTSFKSVVYLLKKRKS